MAELHRRKIDRHRHRRKTIVDPGFQLLKRAAHHPFPDQQNLAAILRNRDEFCRRNQAQFRMLPAQQGFRTDDAPVLQ